MPTTKAPERKTLKKPSVSLQGQLIFAEDQQHIGLAQIRLLQAIEGCGSISAAAKQVGVSYKTAWDRIEAMNNLSDQALVVRAAGGNKGGGTQLTAYGKNVLCGFEAINQEHQQFIHKVGNDIHSFQDVAKFLKGATVNTSARNQFRGTVTRINRGEVNAEIEIQLSESQSIVATITRDSVKELGLKKGAEAIALIKASWVILSNSTAVLSSARNKLVGDIIRITKGAVNTSVTLDLGQGKSLSAVITNISAKEMKLKKGMQVCGIFKASSVILLAL